ncbi:MAG TPA: LysR substrate-binding domain-containing protein [Xanthobacteraceae bacterium]|nr:LysR substrate-binding domain-containing protein [Xanthobacteraceae bacterium]
MELRHLRYFVAVAEELHFSRAAVKLNIATPTLSAQIQALETMLGAQLFTRKTRSVALTHVGKRFLEEARATIKLADQAELVGRQAARGETGSIAVGYIFSAACGGTVSSAIAEFSALHPDVEFDTRRMATIPQMKALIDGTLDVGFTRLPDRYPTGLAGFMIERQSLCAVMPANHRLAALEQIEPEMLAGEPMIATPLEMEMGFSNNIRAITPTRLTMHVVSRVSDPFSVLTMVAAGKGLGVVSESVSRIAFPGVVFRPVVNAARLSDHAVVYRKNEGAPVIKAFIALLRSKAKNV